LVGFPFFTLHSGSVASDVPVSELLQEVEQRFYHIVKFVVVHFETNGLDQTVVGRDNPLVHEVSTCEVLLDGFVENEVFVRLHLKSGDVLDQESVGVEPWQEDVSNDSVNTSFLELEWFGSHNWRVTEIKSAGISTIVFSDLHWWWVVLFTLGHLSSVFSKDNTVDDKVFEWSLVLDGSRDDHEGIEPSSGLIESFSNEISWESLVEFLLRDAEWIVRLSIWHGSRFEPAVEHLWNSLKDSSSFFGWDSDMVNALSVQVTDSSNSRKLFKLFD
jgi:hypothetical protein